MNKINCVFCCAFFIACLGNGIYAADFPVAVVGGEQQLPSYEDFMHVSYPEVVASCGVHLPQLAVFYDDDSDREETLPTYRTAVRDVMSNDLLRAVKMGDLAVMRDSLGRMKPEHVVVARDEHKKTVLHVAVENYRIGELEFLLDFFTIHNFGRYIDMRDCNGDTALHLAVKKRNGDAVMLLLGYGASTLKKDRFGRSPADTADKIVRYMPWIDQVLAKNARDNFEKYCCKYNKAYCAKFLVFSQLR